MTPKVFLLEDVNCACVERMAFPDGNLPEFETTINAAARVFVERKTSRRLYYAVHAGTRHVLAVHGKGLCGPDLMNPWCRCEFSSARSR